MSSASDLRSEIRSLVESQFSPAPGLGDDDSLFDHGVVDSLQVVELVMHLESGFGIRVHPHEITRENFETVSTIAAYVAGKLEPRP